MKKLQEEQQQLMELSENQENTRTRLRELRKVLGSGEILESFDRVVFESVVEKIIIGGYNNEGVEEPLKITFVYKTGIHSNFNGKDFKPKRKNIAAVHNDAEFPIRVTRIKNCIYIVVPTHVKTIAILSHKKENSR